MTKRYHRNVCWDEQFDPWVKNKILQYSLKGKEFTDHYLQRLKLRHITKVPTVDELLAGKLMEVEIEPDGSLHKAVIRTNLNQTKDSLTALGFNDMMGLVYVTAFASPKSYRMWHPDAEKYEKRL